MLSTAHVPQDDGARDLWNLTRGTSSTCNPGTIRAECHTWSSHPTNKSANRVLALWRAWRTILGNSQPGSPPGGGAPLRGGGGDSCCAAVSFLLPLLVRATEAVDGDAQAGAPVHHERLRAGREPGTPPDAQVAARDGPVARVSCLGGRGCCGRGPSPGQCTVDRVPTTVSIAAVDRLTPRWHPAPSPIPRRSIVLGVSCPLVVVRSQEAAGVDPAASVPLTRGVLRGGSKGFGPRLRSPASAPLETSVLPSVLWIGRWDG